MSNLQHVEVRIGDAVRELVEHLVGQLGTLENVERLARENELGTLLASEPAWRVFSDNVHRVWRGHDHVVLRGLPVLGDGTSTLLGALALGAEFRTYRGGRVVKKFIASPWTTALSHTLADGHFHTDLNTAHTPPAVTFIHCAVPDPGGPPHGHVRVARVQHLVNELTRRGADDALAFIRDEIVAMVNDAADAGWSGRILQDGIVRFHPETLRAAQRRHGGFEHMETRLYAVREAALAVSIEIALDEGDALAVSNRRALHYRAAGTVRFKKFPREFESRAVHVLHLMDEPR